MAQLTVVKIGGKVIDDAGALDQFLSDFASLPSPKILVHGGGKIATDLGSRMGIAPNYIDGRRITDAPTLELVTMVYGGLVNKSIVAKLQSKGENALGLTGADGNVLPAVKRPVKEIDYGFAGDINMEDVNTQSVNKLLDADFTPVCCALTHDQAGHLLNTNADTIATVLAGAMANAYEVRLIYCFEQRGVLKDFERQEVISKMNMMDYQELKAQGIISDGMIPKLDNAFHALEAGVSDVSIGHFSDVRALTNNEGAGTKITLS